VEGKNLKSLGMAVHLLEEGHRMLAEYLTAEVEEYASRTFDDAVDRPDIQALVEDRVMLGTPEKEEAPPPEKEAPRAHTSGEFAPIVLEALRKVDELHIHAIRDAIEGSGVLNDADRAYVHRGGSDIPLWYQTTNNALVHLQRKGVVTNGRHRGWYRVDELVRST
jgi:hypothetical protein